MSPQLLNKDTHKVLHWLGAVVNFAIGSPAVDDAVDNDRPEVIALPLLTLVVLHFIPKLIELVKGLVGLGVERADDPRG